MTAPFKCLVRRGEDEMVKWTIEGKSRRLAEVPHGAKIVRVHGREAVND